MCTTWSIVISIFISFTIMFYAFFKKRNVKLYINEHFLFFSYRMLLSEAWVCLDLQAKLALPCPARLYKRVVHLAVELAALG